MSKIGRRECHWVARVAAGLAPLLPLKMRCKLVQWGLSARIREIGLFEHGFNFEVFEV
jgi:hypothetical protein